VESNFPKEMIAPSPILLLSKDVKRRAASYNRGFFKVLRRASLEGFQNILALEVLKAAEKNIENLPLHRQKAVRIAIAQDEKWVMDW
jgi:hypothetical protein